MQEFFFPIIPPARKWVFHYDSLETITSKECIRSTTNDEKWKVLFDGKMIYFLKFWKVWLSHKFKKEVRKHSCFITRVATDLVIFRKKVKHRVDYRGNTQKGKEQKKNLEKGRVLFDSNTLFLTISKNTESMLLSFEEFIHDTSLTQRNIFLFDKDGTLTSPNESIDDEWSFFLSELLQKKKCILLTARDIKTLSEQIISKLSEDTPFKNLIFWCSNGSEIYEWYSWREYTKVSSLPGNIEKFLPDIQKWVDQINQENRLHITIEPRSATMIALVCIPRDSSKEERENFDPDKKKRNAYGHTLRGFFSSWEIIPGGSTTIDVSLCTKYDGLMHLYRYYHFWSTDAIYFWDNFWEYGNDTPILRDPIPSVNIKNPEELFTFSDHAH